MKMQEFKLTPIEQKVVALSMIGILERNGITDHGVNDRNLIEDLAGELMTQVGEVIPLLPLFSEGYGK